MFDRIVKKMKSKAAVIAPVAAGAALASGSAHAEMTSLIDFTTLGTNVTPLITTAVTTAAGLGAMILAAKLCWGFFKRFSKG